MNGGGDGLSKWKDSELQRSCDLDRDLGSDYAACPWHSLTFSYVPNFVRMEKLFVDRRTDGRTDGRPASLGGLREGVDVTMQ